MSQYDIAIIGGGISGLSALHFVRRLKPDRSVVLFEAESRLGGTIGTDHINGYSLDCGPNGFLDREPLTLRLCNELGLKDRLERAGENVINRFILRKGKLRVVPMSPRKFVMSHVLSLAGKLRVLAEPLMPTVDGSAVDESVYDFARRRIGKEAADYLVQPMVSGIFGGLADKLSLRSCFPIMHEMETEYGSLFRAMMAKARKAKAAGCKAGGPSGPGGWLTSFKGGLNVIIDHFDSRYSKSIRKGESVEAIEKDKGAFRIVVAGGRFERAHTVILAIPAYQAATIVRGLSEGLSGAFRDIAYAPIAVVCMGYPIEAVRTRLDGFGFLVPKKEGKRILGSIWTSSIFEDRAPQGKVQFRTMVGGDGDHKAAELVDNELIEHVIRDLDDILGIEGDPELVKVYRWSRGIPQYHLGHLEIVRRVEQELRSLKNIYISGNAYYGIGLNDCVKQSYKVASLL